MHLTIAYKKILSSLAANLSVSTAGIQELYSVIDESPRQKFITTVGIAALAKTGEIYDYPVSVSENQSLNNFFEQLVAALAEICRCTYGAKQNQKPTTMTDYAGGVMAVFILSYSSIVEQAVDNFQKCMHELSVILGKAALKKEFIEKLRKRLKNMPTENFGQG